MNQESYSEEYSLDGLREAESALIRINQLLEQITAKQEKAIGEISRGINSASAEIEKLNSKIERDTGRALSSMVSGTKTTAQAMRGVWQGFLDFFLGQIIAKMNRALGGLTPGGGGIFGALFGGILSLLGLQEGGIVKGSRGGTPVIVGENFTDELVIPLSKLNLGSYASGIGGTDQEILYKGPPYTPQVNLYPQFIIENNSPLDADIEIYKMAKSGKESVEAAGLNGGAGGTQDVL